MGDSFSDQNSTTKFNPKSFNIIGRKLCLPGSLCCFFFNFSQGCFCIHGNWRWEWSEADGTRKPFDDNRAQSPLWGKGSLPSNKGELFMSPEMRSSPIHPFTSPSIYLSDPASLLMWSSSNFLVYWRNSGNSSPSQPARKHHKDLLSMTLRILQLREAINYCFLDQIP